MITTLFPSFIPSSIPRFKVANGGVPFDPPKVEAPKKEVAAPAPKGPSKKCEKKWPKNLGGIFLYCYQSFHIFL